MKHLIVTILMVFAFFSLSNAQQHQDHAKALRDPIVFRNILLNDIKYFKSYLYERDPEWHKSYEYLEMPTKWMFGDPINKPNEVRHESNLNDEYINTNRIVSYVGLNRDKFTHIESDGTVQHVYSKYRLDATFDIDNIYYYVRCKADSNNSDSNIINCEMSKFDNKKEKYSKLRGFKTNYSIVLDVIEEIQKLKYVKQKLED